MSFRSKFPGELVDRLAQRETASRRNLRPIYSLHRWWARRPGAVFRALLLTVFSGDDETAESVAHRYFQPRGGSDLRGKLVVDPFMGGGTTVFEALRLGASVAAADINPVAWWIVKQSITPTDIAQLDAAYQELTARLSGRLLSHYETHCPHCNAVADGLYFFWVKQLTCPVCESSFELHPDFKLARLRSGDYAVYCPECGHIEQASSLTDERTCTRCGHQYVPKQGHVRRGRYTCPRCGARGLVVDAVATRSEPLPHRLFAIEYRCSEHGRGYKQADSFDLARYDRASRELEQLKSRLKLPYQDIPPGLNTDQMRKHNYLSWRQLFNERQLLGLGLLLQAIEDIADRPARELLLTVFSEVLDYNNMLCEYNYSYRKIGNLFGLHAFNVSMRPVENNLWGVSVGSGTFTRYYRKLRAAKEYALSPYERDLEGTTMTLPEEGVLAPPLGEVRGEKALSLDRLFGDGPAAAVLYRDSRHLPLPDGVADAVVTDPPYFDNVMYGELSEFYYAWLHLALAREYVPFAPPHLDESAEVLTDPERGKDNEDYLQGLMAIFREAHRVLRDEGPLVFTFHHRSVEAWAILLRALTGAGFVVDETVPVHAEMSSSIHIRGKRAPKTDVIVVCYKVNGVPRASLPGARREGQRDEMPWKERLCELVSNLSPDRHDPEDARVVLFGEALRELSHRAIRTVLDGDQVRTTLETVSNLVLNRERGRRNL